MAAVTINAQQFEALRYGEKPLLVDFWAPWCVYCRRIGPAYERIGEKYGEDIVVAKINVDHEGALARQEQIEVLPTLVLYRAGMELGSIVAPESGAAIEEFITRCLENNKER